MDERAQFAEIEGKLRATLREIINTLESQGRATVEWDVYPGQHRLVPTNANALTVSVYVQQPAEISLFPEEPGTGRTVTVDLWDRDPATLIRRTREYLEAIVRGDVDLTLRRSGSAGRFRVRLDSSNEQTHLYNVLFARGVRGRNWQVFSPEPY
jgi:hypothetical protein